MERNSIGPRSRQKLPASVRSSRPAGFGRAGVGALLCALLSLSHLPPAHAQTRVVGVNDHVIWRTPAQEDVAVAKYLDSNTKFIRADVQWNQIELTKGVFNETNPYLQRIDYFMDKCTAAGIRVLLVPCTAPSWNNGGHASGCYAPIPGPTGQGYTDYADFCEFLLRRYTETSYINAAGKHTLEGIELWNEPDLCDLFFLPYTRDSPDAATLYGNMVVAAGTRLKSVRATLGAGDVQICAPVISEVHSVCSPASGQTTAWMDAFYAVPNVTSAYDVFSWHSYWQSAGPNWLPTVLPPCFSTTNQSQSVMGKLTATGTNSLWGRMVTKGDSSKPNWLTEIGGAARSNTADHPNRLLSFAEQNTHIADAISVLGAGSVTKLDHVYWYDLLDDSTSSGFEQVFGLAALNTSNPIVYPVGGVNLVGASITPKPAYATYKNAAKGDNTAHTGTWTGKAVLSGTASWTNFYQIPAVASNTNYTFSFWLKGTGKIRLKIQPSNWSTLLAYQEYTATPNWTLCTLPGFNTGTNTALVYCFQDSGNVAGTLFLDDCFMGIAGGANKLAKPGFESGDTSWTKGANYSIVQSP